MKQCNKAYLNNTELEFSGNLVRPNFRKRGEYEVGDAVLWDSKSGMFRVIPQEDITTITDTTRYTPTGVIAIPSSHDVYGTKEAGVIALKFASYATPDVGIDIYDSIYYGGGNIDYPELYNFDKVCRVGIESGTQQNNAVVNNIPTTTALVSYLPSDIFNTGSLYTKAIDGTFYYYRDLDSWNDCIPSPYLADGSRNPIYYQVAPPSSSSNALSDFNGRSNTEVLCSKAIEQADWKVATSIINSGGSGYHPAACCCWRFHTVGTNQGDWYLPAAGELGYVHVRRKKITETITKLQSYFGIDLLKLSTNELISSSDCESNTIRLMRLANGAVARGNKNGRDAVIPFTRLK